MLFFTFVSLVSFWASHAFAKQSEYWERDLTPFAAVYNGTLSMTASSPTRACVNVADLNIANYSLLIGSQDAKTMNGQTFQRSLYDPNPFWFLLEGKKTSKNGSWIELMSTTGGYNLTKGAAPDALWVYQYWNITSTRVDDGWDFSAVINRVVGHDSAVNRYSVVECTKTVTTWPIGPSSGKDGDTQEFTGRISPEKASLSWKMNWTSYGDKYSRSWVFEGTWDPMSPKLVVGDSLKTQGYSTYYPSSANTSESGSSSSSGSGSSGSSGNSSGSGPSNSSSASGKSEAVGMTTSVMSVGLASLATFVLPFVL